MPSQQAFSEIYNITFPEDTDSDNVDCFDITPASLSDHNCFIFTVCDGVKVRILASELAYEIENGRHKLQDIAVSEAFVSVSEVLLVLGQESVCFKLLTKTAAGSELLERVREQTGLVFHIGF